jgi:hypothetical protein
MSQPLDTDGVMFDFRSAQDIADVVRAAKARQPGLQGQIRSPNSSAQQPAFRAEITGVSGSHYSWKKRDIVAGVLVDSSPLVSDANYSAYEANGSGVAIGDQVQLDWAGYDADGNPQYIFSVGGAIPRCQYEGMLLGMVTTNQTGWFFPSATPMGSTSS